MREMRCTEGHLQATVKDGQLLVACPQCSHAARRRGEASPVLHAFSLDELMRGGAMEEHYAQEAKTQTATQTATA